VLQRVDAEDHLYLASVSVFVLLNITDTNLLSFIELFCKRDINIKNTNAAKRDRVLFVLRLVGPLKTYVSFAKEPYERDYILQKRPT